MTVAYSQVSTGSTVNNEAAHNVIQPAGARIVVPKDIIRASCARSAGICPCDQEDDVQAKSDRCCKLFGVPVPRFDLFRQPEQEIPRIQVVLDTL